jgi:branched-chain amino acid transport system substrate-binding protein
MGKTLAHVSRSILHAKKAAIVVAEDCPYCHDLAQAFEKEFELSGGTIKIKIGVLESQRKFDDVVKLLKKEDVDVILIPNYELTSIRIISALIDSGIDKPFLGGDGWGDVGEEFFKELHGRKISSYSVSHWNPDLKTPTSLAFKKSFISEFGKSPNDTAVLAYDSMMMLIQAILNLKNYSRDAVELELNKLHIFRGVTGTFKITPNNAPLKTIVLLKTNNNRFDVVTTIEPN